MESIERARDVKNLALNKEIRETILYSGLEYGLDKIKKLLRELQGPDSWNTSYTWVFLRALFLPSIQKASSAKDLKEVIKLWTKKCRGRDDLDQAAEAVLEYSDKGDKGRVMLEVLVDAGVNLNNIILNIKLLRKLEKQEPNLAKIKNLLSRLQGVDSCRPNCGYALLRSFREVSVNQVQEVKEIMKLWAEKRGEYDLSYALGLVLTGKAFKEEKIRCEMFKALIESGVDINTLAYFRDGRYPSLEKVLEGAEIQGREGKYVNLELVHYILKSGGACRLVKVLNSIDSERSSTMRQVPELFAIWDIFKEAKPELQEIDFTNISKDQTTEIEIIGEKVAKLYLYCKETGLTAEWINNNKKWVLTFFPLDLKYLAAIKANAQFVLEDIKELTNNFVLENKVTTFLTPVAVEPVSSTKSL